MNFKGKFPHFLFGFIVLLVVGVFGGTIYSFNESDKIHFDGHIDKELFGQFGDFIAGVVGTILNFGAIIFLYINYREQLKIASSQLASARRDHWRYLDEIAPVISFRLDNVEARGGDISIITSKNAVYNLKIISDEPEYVKFYDLPSLVTDFNKDQEIIFKFKVDTVKMFKENVNVFIYPISFTVQFSDRIGTSYVQRFFTKYLNIKSKAVISFPPKRLSLLEK